MSRDNRGITADKRAEGAPIGNENAKKHGFHQAKRILNEFGMRTIDGRTEVGRALNAWRMEIIEDLGGDPSAQQRAVVDVLVRSKLILDSIDAYILTMDSPVNQRSRAVFRVVKDRNQLAATFARMLRMLGLERRLPVDERPVKLEFGRKTKMSGMDLVEYLEGIGREE